MAHLYRVILPVSPIEAGASFYAAVLEQPGARVSPGRHYFDCEGTILACFDPEADHERRDPKPNPEHIYFAVDDLDAALERCRRRNHRRDRVVSLGRNRVLRERSVWQPDPLRRSHDGVHRPSRGGQAALNAPPGG